MKEGLQKGRINGLQENIIEILQVRFGAVSDNTRILVFRCTDENQLKVLTHEAITIECIDNIGI